MDSKKENNSAHSAVLCIYSTNYVFAVWNFLMEEPVWKFPSESAEIGELYPDTLVRGSIEEANLVIPVIRNEIGVIEKFGNDAVKVSYVSKRKGLHREHLQHFYKIRISDSHLQSLSDKLLFADKDELLWTWAFPFMRPLKMENFHRGHKARFQEMIDFGRYTA